MTEPEVPNLLEMPPGARYSARLPMAMAYAAVMHSPHTRKDELGTPYITHPLAVASMVWHYGLAVPAYSDELEDLVIAALLHDVVEDAGGADLLRQIEQMFGPRVAQLVYAATDSTTADPAAKPPWRPRKEQHLARVRKLSEVTPAGIRDAGACLVIGCDKLHNLSDTAHSVAAHGDGFLERFNGGVAGTRWYYRQMFEALRPALPDAMVADFTVRLATLGA